MGTSSPFGGPTNDRPLVPSWVDDLDDGGSPPDGDADGDDGGNDDAPSDPPANPPPRPKPDLPQAGQDGRFSAPRANFTSFARSGGTDRRSLGRAVSGYVGGSMGSPATAARRMSPSYGAGSGLLRFLGDVGANGVVEALRRLDLSALAGRPIEEVFAGLADYICPEGGTIDEGISRNAFIETIADLASEGITDIDGLTSEQMTTVFELYVAHTIEARLCNDIGARSVALPANPAAAQKVEDQLHDFIVRGVADAVAGSGVNIQALSPDEVTGFVTQVYESAFMLLQAMGDEEGNA